MATRDELHQLLERARTEMRTGGSLVAMGALFFAIFFVLDREGSLSNALLGLVGAGSGMLGAFKLVQGLHDRRSLRAQLRARELPVARLLER